MGSYQGAEVCELVGLYILFELKSLEIDLGLYRDDGLGVLELAIYVWKLKNQGINENDICVKWNILDKIPAYHPSSKTCRLCIREIYRTSWGPGL